MPSRRLITVLAATAVFLAGAVAVPAAASATPAPTASATTADPGDVQPHGWRYSPADTRRIWSGTIGTTARNVELDPGLPVGTGIGGMVLNVEVADPSHAGYLRVTPRYKSGTSVVTQDFAAHQTISSLVTVGGSGSTITLKTSAGSARVYVDLAGTYDADGTTTFTPTPPTRAFSAAVGTAPVRVPLAGTHGIPADAAAVVLTAEVSAPTATGYVRVTPYGRDAQVAAQEFTPGRTVSNLQVVKLRSGSAQVRLSAGRAHVFLDVSGYYRNGDDGAVFVPVAPTRVLATTVGQTPVATPVSGRAALPTAVRAVTGSVEVTRPSAPGYVRVTPAGTDAQVATQEFGAGQSIAGAVLTAATIGDLASTAQVSVSRGTAVVHVDVTGYFADRRTGVGTGVVVNGEDCTGGPTSDPSSYARPQFTILRMAPRTNTYTLCPAALAVATSGTGTTNQEAVQYAVTLFNWGASTAAASPAGARARPWPLSDQTPNGGPVVAGNPYGTCTGAQDPACSYVLGYWQAWDAAQNHGLPDPAGHRWWLSVESDFADFSVADDTAFVEGAAAYLGSLGVPVGVRTAPSVGRLLFGTVPATSPLHGMETSLINPHDLTGLHQDCRSTSLFGGPIVSASDEAHTVVACR
ncbi:MULTISPECIES: hypothetical protein [unclassified Curtobacterium]|uniref:hypothetical protein n=1 Tax=unclassified Curtobacterium TaxID=257496 RepID=UPI0039B003E3